MTSFPIDAFGDPFDVARLPLPRPADGYAVQQLDTDLLLDRCSGQFRAVREPLLQGLFPTFESAHASATQFLRDRPQQSKDHHLAIVPASYDAELQRHILIYGVLRTEP